MQLLSRATVTSLFLMITLILVMPVWADVFVYNLYGKPSNFNWLRNGEKQTKVLVPNLYLQDGDKIKVVDKKFKEERCFITLLLEDCSSVTLDYNKTFNEPYRIENNITSFTLAGNITSNIKIGWRYDIEMKEASAKTSGEPLPSSLEMPLLEGDDAQIEAGEQVLHLGWNGGTPPYHIQVTHEDTQKSFLERNIEEETITSAKQNWIVGDYQVIISDSKNNEIKQYFTVVDQIAIKPSLSNYEKEIKQQHCLPETTTQPTLLANWLITQNKKWRLEAYQHVAPIALEVSPIDQEKYYPAFWMKQSLKDIGQ